MVMRSARRGESERAEFALCPAHGPCRRVGQRGGEVCGWSWVLLLVGPPHPPLLSLLLPCLLQHSLSPPPLSCCSPSHPQSHLVQAPVSQCRSHFLYGEPVGSAGAEVKRRGPCRTQTDLDGWRKTCETKKTEVRKK